MPLKIAYMLYQLIVIVYCVLSAVNWPAVFAVGFIAFKQMLFFLFKCGLVIFGCLSIPMLIHSVVRMWIRYKNAHIILSGMCGVLKINSQLLDARIQLWRYSVFTYFFIIPIIVSTCIYRIVKFFFAIIGLNFLIKSIKTNGVTTGVLLRFRFRRKLPLFFVLEQLANERYLTWGYRFYSRRKKQVIHRFGSTQRFYFFTIRLSLTLSVISILSYIFLVPTFILRFPFLEPSGVEAPVENIQYYWNKTEFGQQMRATLTRKPSVPLNQYKVADAILWQAEFDARFDYWEKFFNSNKDMFNRYIVPTYTRESDTYWFWDRTVKCFAILLLFIAAPYWLELIGFLDFRSWGTKPGGDEGGGGGDEGGGWGG